VARGTLTGGVDPRAVVLVEAVSDEAALEALAARRSRDLSAEGVRIVRIGGAHSVGRFLGRFDPDVVLTGLCDAGEEAVFRRALERAGLGADLTRAELERLGFYVCDADLEDELIRSLGTAGVEAVLETQGELDGFRMFQQQPAQRGRQTDAQLRRFLGTRSGRKQHYARLLVEALDLSRVPRPLDGVLAHLEATSSIRPDSG
jgi:hypothetical protein